MDHSTQNQGPAVTDSCTPNNTPSGCHAPAIAQGGACPMTAMAERVTRLERIVEAQGKDIGHTTQTMTRLETILERVEVVVNELKVQAAKPNKYWELVVSALIQWGAPLAVIAFLYSLVRSGAISLAH